MITKSVIKKYHKIFGYMTLILSILFLLISKEYKLMERLIGAFGINLTYHMVYFYFAKMYEFSKRMRNHNKFNKSIGGIMLGLFSIFGILGSIFLIYVIVQNAISSNEYLKLFVICVPMGLFLGASSLFLDIKNE